MDAGKQQELKQVMWVLAEHLAHTAVVLLPFLPQTASKVLERLRLKKDWVIKDTADFSTPFVEVGTVIDRGAPLFPKLDEEAR